MKKRILLSLVLAGLIFFAQQTLAAQNASLYFSSLSGNYSVGQKINLAIFVNPNGATYDTAVANINFPADKLQVQSFSLSPNFSTPSPDNSFDNSAGTISYGAGITGGTSELLNFGTITFNVISSGNASVSFAPGSAIINAGESVPAQIGSSAVFTLATPAPATPTPAPKATTPSPAPAKSANQPAVGTQQPSNPGTAALSPNSVPVVSEALKGAANWNIISVIELIGLALAILFIAAVIFFFMKRKGILLKKQHE